MSRASYSLKRLQELGAATRIAAIIARNGVERGEESGAEQPCPLAIEQEYGSHSGFWVKYYIVVSAGEENDAHYRLRQLLRLLADMAQKEGLGSVVWDKVYWDDAVELFAPSIRTKIRIDRSAVCRRIQIGTTTTTVTVPVETREEEVEVPVYKWVCGPITEERTL